MKIIDIKCTLFSLNAHYKGRENKTRKLPFLAESDIEVARVLLATSYTTTAEKSTFRQLEQKGEINDHRTEN